MKEKAKSRFRAYRFTGQNGIKTIWSAKPCRSLQYGFRIISDTRFVLSFSGDPCYTPRVPEDSCETGAKRDNKMNKEMLHALGCVSATKAMMETGRRERRSQRAGGGGSPVYGSLYGNPPELQAESVSE